MKVSSINLYIVISYVYSLEEIFSMAVSFNSIRTIINISESSIIKGKNKQSCKSLERRIKIKSCKIVICFFCFYFCFIFVPVTGLLNPSFNCFVKYTLSLVDKVTIGTNNFVLVILNVVSLLLALSPPL